MLAEQIQDTQGRDLKITGRRRRTMSPQRNSEDRTIAPKPPLNLLTPIDDEQMEEFEAFAIPTSQEDYENLPIERRLAIHPLLDQNQ